MKLQMIRRRSRMDTKKELLIKSAARLYSLGIELEGAKAHIRELAAAGNDYTSPEMIQAAKDYSELKRLWDGLEQEHLKLKDEILSGQE